MTGIDLINELNNLSKRLSTEITLMERYGKEFAAAERDYKIALNQESLKLKNGGMAVTLIDKVVYGVREVADKRFNRDVAETMWKTAQEKINTTKLQIRILDSQIAREWSNGS
jgi:hypothetical protein